MRKRRGARDGLFINGVHFPQEHFQRRGQIANGPHLNDDDVEDLEEAPETKLSRPRRKFLTKPLPPAPSQNSGLKSLRLNA
jgi:hypothetical protein